ncbi:hypothetical protein ACLI4Z_13085 [Natrialbaceae archaeon A-arb3/5]
MMVRTYVHDARERIDAEGEHVAEKLAAYDQFERELDDIQVCTPGGPRRQGHTNQNGVTTTATILAHTERNDDTLKRIRSSFAETVRPLSTDDLDEPEPVLTTVQEELGEDVAYALSPATDSRFTPEVKNAIRSMIARRRTDLQATDRALAVEKRSLQHALDELEPVIDWICRVNETPLSDLGFDALRTRHETVAAHRSRCNQVAADRQAIIHGAARESVSTAAHRTLLAYLYRDLPTSFPVLTTVTRLDERCQDCQRTVRDHLVRRI